MISWQIVASQNLVEVAESTLKVAAFGEEIFYYGFAEGDKLIFEFKEMNGKELKEIEIIEWPESSKFMDYKSKKISSKTIEINRTGIYKFRFANSALSGRICKFKIQRLPASISTQNFDTNVYWRTVYDTTYTPIQEQYLIKSDTMINNFKDQVAKVSSQNAINGNTNRNVVDFDLPPNTISWSYYLGVGKEGNQAYEKSKDQFVKSAGAQLATLSGYGPMAALALFGINTFSKVHGRDNVKYWFIPDMENVQLFNSGNTFLQYKHGDVINDASQMKYPLSGKVYLALLNDNLIEPIEVTVSLTAIQLEQSWGFQTVNKMKVSTRSEPYLKD
ncbi:MAG: hypothetical protein EBU52_08835 [Cytophagia bacterium]|nr:hypothetical protein [Cytophagia bacterium]